MALAIEVILDADDTHSNDVVVSRLLLTVGKDEVPEFRESASETRIRE